VKTFLFSLIFGASLASQAGGPEFGAFVRDNILYVTILADSCNHFSVGLRVAGICHQNRMTANYADVCEADLLVGSTKMACHSDEVVPYSAAIDLAQAGVAREAKVLILNQNGRAIRVKINK
jgi:hypothetical protein